MEPRSSFRHPVIGCYFPLIVRDDIVIHFHSCSSCNWISIDLPTQAFIACHTARRQFRSSKSFKEAATYVDDSLARVYVFSLAWSIFSKARAPSASNVFTTAAGHLAETMSSNEVRPLSSIAFIWVLWNTSSLIIPQLRNHLYAFTVWCSGVLPFQLALISAPACKRNSTICTRS